MPMARAVAVLSVLVLVSWGRSGLAQDSAYTSLLDRYLGKDQAGPVAELLTWDLQRVEGAIEGALPIIGRDVGEASRPHMRLMVGALLHTECAARSVELGLDENSRKHLEWAGTYVALCDRLVGQSALVQLESFRRLWYRLACELGLILDLASARKILRNGMRQFPRDAGLLLVEGCLEEAEARALPAGRETKLSEAMRNRVDRRRRLERAEALYSEALAADATLAEAQLRRGRIRQLLRRPSDAEADLLAVIHGSREGRIVYLAHLFRGQLREDGNNLAEAAESYRAATSVGRQAQAANLGLAHVLGRLGDRSGSAAAIDRALEPREGVDPWWPYGLGLPVGTGSLPEQIQRLRLEVRP